MSNSEAVKNVDTDVDENRKGSNKDSSEHDPVGLRPALAPPQSSALTAVDVDNIVAFMKRVDLKAAEARVFVGLEIKLSVLQQALAAATQE